MKLIEVEYLEESSTAIFFTITFETKPILWYESKLIKKRAFLEKWKSRAYSNSFQWSDNSKNSDQFNTVFIEEMILKYEQRKKTL